VIAGQHGGVGQHADQGETRGRAAGGGAIVNNASIAGVGGVPGMSAYVAAKHDVVGLTRATALECADRGRADGRSGTRCRFRLRACPRPAGTAPSSCWNS
jgi:NAD(P)-dependent dehydrogenase (short-subunit alcohol dehydrogenase family)